MSDSNALRVPATRWAQPQMPLQPNMLRGPMPAVPAAPPPAPARVIAEPPRDLAGVEHRVSTRIPTSKRLNYDPHEMAALQIGHDAMQPGAIGGNDVAPEHHETTRNNVEKSYRSAINTLRVRYPHINTTNVSDAEAAERMINHMHNNIVFMWNKVRNEPWRDAAVDWYRGANKIAKELSSQHGISHRQAAAVVANLSPQKDWDQNANLAERLLKIRGEHQATAVTPEMMRVMQGLVEQRTPKTREALARYVRGIKEGDTLASFADPIHQALFIRAHDEAHNPDRSFQVISPTGKRTPARTKAGEDRSVAWGSIGEIASALQALQHDELPNISRSLGGNHKVRSFYNNIIAPDAPHGDVTADTHAINVALMRPMGSKAFYVAHGLGTGGGGSNATGANGIYGLYADAYRRAARTISELEQRRYLPREVQSVTWEAIRNMFERQHKAVHETTLEPTHQVGRTARDAWNAARYGLIPFEHARELIYRTAGGVKTPAWHGVSNA